MDLQKLQSLLAAFARSKRLLGAQRLLLLRRLEQCSKCKSVFALRFLRRDNTPVALTLSGMKEIQRRNFSGCLFYYEPMRTWQIAQKQPVRVLRWTLVKPSYPIPAASMRVVPLQECSPFQERSLCTSMFDITFLFGMMLLCSSCVSHVFTSRYECDGTICVATASYVCWCILSLSARKMGTCSGLSLNRVLVEKCLKNLHNKQHHCGETALICQVEMVHGKQ